MAFTLSTALRNNTLETGIASEYNSQILEGRSGSRPAAADTAPTGTVIFSITLPADAFATAASGAIAKAGTWQDTSADATGTLSWFRIRKTGDLGTTNTTDSRLDNDIALSGSNLLIMDSLSVTAGQVVTINTFTITMPTG